MKHSKKQKKLPRSFSPGRPSTSGPVPATEHSDTLYELTSEDMENLVKAVSRAIETIDLEKEVIHGQMQLIIRILQTLMDRMSLSLDGVLDYLDLSETQREYCQKLFEESEDPSDPED